jgi:hypothetical protein
MYEGVRGALRADDALQRDARESSFPGPSCLQKRKAQNLKLETNIFADQPAATQGRIFCLESSFGRAEAVLDWGRFCECLDDEELGQLYFPDCLAVPALRAEERFGRPGA